MKILLVSPKYSFGGADIAEMRRLHRGFIKAGYCATWSDKIIKGIKWDVIITDQNILNQNTWANAVRTHLFKLKAPYKAVWILDHCGKQCSLAKDRWARVNKYKSKFDLIMTQDSTWNWGPKHLWLCQGVEEDEFEHIPKEQHLNQPFDICFIGTCWDNYYPERKKLLERLGSKYKVLLMGNTHVNNCAYMPAAYGGESYMRCASLAKINLILPQARGSKNYISNRIFLAGAAENCCIVWRQDGLEKWVPRRNSSGQIMWHTRNHIDRLLTEANERRNMGIFLRYYVLQNHTYKHRAEYIMERINADITNK